MAQSPWRYLPTTRDLYEPSALYVRIAEEIVKYGSAMPVPTSWPSRTTTTPRSTSKVHIYRHPRAALLNFVAIAALHLVIQAESTNRLVIVRGDHERVPMTPPVLDNFFAYPHILHV